MKFNINSENMDESKVKYHDNDHESGVSLDVEIDGGFTRFHEKHSK